MKLYRPLDGFWNINQSFGENKACVPILGGAVINCDGKKPPQGYRSVYGENGHMGIDLAGGIGTPVYACREGVVQSIDTNYYSGFDVRIFTKDGEFLHIYEHLDKWNVNVGQDVVTGELIGWIGTTGYSSGPHLHFECRDKNGVSFDPMPLMDNVSAREIFKLNNTVKHLTQLVTELTMKIKLFLKK